MKFPNRLSSSRCDFQRSARARRRRFAPVVDALEGRALLSTLVIGNVASTDNENIFGTFTSN